MKVFVVFRGHGRFIEKTIRLLVRFLAFSFDDNSAEYNQIFENVTNTRETTVLAAWW